MNFAVRMASGQTDAEPRLPGSLQINRRLSQWMHVRSDGVVEICPGKVELGQGIVTALAQIAAEELDVSIARIRMIPASTPLSPDEAVTSGSLSIQESGTAIRYACAEARAILLGAAAIRLDAAIETLRVADGEIAAANGKRTSYWAFADDNLLDREASATVPPKMPSTHCIVGTAVERLDIPDKVYGRSRFIQDLELPGLLYGRVLRPPSPRASLASLDGSAASALPGVVAIVRDGNFVGVLAEREEVAVAALAKLRAGTKWNESETLPDQANFADWLKTQPLDTKVVDTRETAAPAEVARTVRARYTKPYIAHASIGPSCAAAQWTASGVRVWTHSQGIYNLRADLAATLGLALPQVGLEHVENAGCYGHNAADDVALDAALLARAADGRPVKTQWTREDDLSWPPFGPGMAIELEADLDARGVIVGWRHELWSNGHSSRPGRSNTPALLAAWHLAKPFEQPLSINPPLAAGGGADRNAVPLYDFPAWRIINHRLLAMPIRASALRSLGGFGNVFAIESFLDELAAERGEDPVEFRLRHLSDARARAVIEAAAARAGWHGRKKREGIGYGIGFARYKNMGAYCAVIAEIEAGREIQVHRLVVAVDVGQVINPDGVANQMEGGAIQAASWTLKEGVRFDRMRITSTAWEDYPILIFSAVPKVEVEIVSRPDERSLGAGEAAQGPTAAAIANAVFDALGVRVRDLPITPERIVAAME
jgi:CO/xanthine dehydrogenase Mo-binding subunit